MKVTVWPAWRATILLTYLIVCTASAAGGASTSSAYDVSSMSRVRAPVLASDTRRTSASLSGETTTGSYPLECVEVMKNIVRSVEPTEKRPVNEAIQLREPKAKMLRAYADATITWGTSVTALIAWARARGP